MHKLGQNDDYAGTLESLLALASRFLSQTTTYREAKCCPSEQPGTYARGLQRSIVMDALASQIMVQTISAVNLDPLMHD